MIDTKWKIHPKHPRPPSNEGVTKSESELDDYLAQPPMALSLEHLQWCSVCDCTCRKECSKYDLTAAQCF